MSHAKGCFQPFWAWHCMGGTYNCNKPFAAGLAFDVFRTCKADFSSSTCGSSRTLIFRAPFCKLSFPGVASAFTAANAAAAIAAASSLMLEAVGCVTLGARGTFGPFVPVSCLPALRSFLLAALASRSFCKVEKSCQWAPSHRIC